MVMSPACCSEGAAGRRCERREGTAAAGLSAAGAVAAGLAATEAVAAEGGTSCTAGLLAPAIETKHMLTNNNTTTWRN